MLLDSIIDSCALDATYGKGVALMRTGKADVFDVFYDENDESAHISAFVEGSSDNDYMSTVVLEMETGRVRSYSSRYVSNETWNVGLRVSRGKTSYIARHIDEIVHAWQADRLYSYGKNLAFVHRRSAFTDHANAILEMLAPIVDAQCSTRPSTSKTAQLRWHAPPSS